MYKAGNKYFSESGCVLTLPKEILLIEHELSEAYSSLKLLYMELRMHNSNLRRENKDLRKRYDELIKLYNNEKIQL